MALPATKLQRPLVQPSINYFDHRVVGKNVKRWVFFPGDTIVPQRKADITWLAPGGEETPSPCIQKYGRGFVPRGLAAMLELGGELMPMKHLGEHQATAWQGIALNEEAIKSNLGFVPVYPGDGLQALRTYYMNDQGIRRGLDELTALVGREWEECHSEDGTGILDRIEGEWFGDGMEPTLRGLQEQILHGADAQEFRGRFADPVPIDISKLKEEMLRMCSEFRLWAENKLSIEHANLKIGTKADHVYSYSPLAELLLVQVEIPRQDQPLAEMARMHKDLMSREPYQVAPTMSATDLDMIERRLDERLAAARKADAQRIAELESELKKKADKAPRSLITRPKVEPKATAE